MGRFAATFLALLTILFAAPAAADDLHGLLAPGNAAVTGFSGARDGAIDLDGPSLRVIDLGDAAGPLDAHFFKSNKPFTAKAGDVGQAFGVALDNAVPPNIFVAATSAYGLPLVVRRPDGKIERVAVGEPGAMFMPGQFGPGDKRGGPGSVWRIDGTTGAIALFADVQAGGKSNPAPSLGNLAFDATGNTLLVADRWSGLIHRFRMDGSEIALYDHGASGRPAAGLPASPPTLAEVNVQDPAFDTRKPESWGFAPPERRPFGLAVRGGRLYYAIAAGLEIWSVSLNPDGGIGADARREIVVPPGDGASEISKITFDDSGRMYLAERPAPSGAQDFEALTPQGIGRVLRYLRDPLSPPDAPQWRPEPQEYAIGFPRALRNGNGGVEIGYDYDERGRFDRRSCGGFLWSTGEVLRHADDAQLAERLSASGPLDLTGLQGNRTPDVRPRNLPPMATVFTDYNEHFDDSGARGHMGDLVIWRVCGEPRSLGWRSDFDFGYFEFDEEEIVIIDEWTDEGGECVGYRCCPRGMSPDASGHCRPWCHEKHGSPRDWRLCGLGFDPRGPRCLDGSTPRNDTPFGCVGASPILSAKVCPAGWTRTDIPGAGEICAPTPQQRHCRPGEQAGLDGVCRPPRCKWIEWPDPLCCPPDSKITPHGECCPPGAEIDAHGECCPPGSRLDVHHLCCPAGSLIDATGACCPPGATLDVHKLCCPSGRVIDGNGACCPPGARLDSEKNCCPINAVTDKRGRCCPVGAHVNPQTGECSRVIPTPISTPACGPNETGISGQCCANNSVLKTGEGRLLCCPHPLDALGRCERPRPPPVCAPGSVPLRSGACCPSDRVTQDGTCGVDVIIPLFVVPEGGLCANGAAPDSEGRCSAPQWCPEGRRPDRFGHCPDIRVCPNGQAPNAFGECPVRLCPDGRRPNLRGECAPLPTPTLTPTPTPNPTPTRTLRPTPTPTPTFTPTPAPTRTPRPTRTFTPTIRPLPTHTPRPIIVPRETFTPRHVAPGKEEPKHFQPRQETPRFVPHKEESLKPNPRFEPRHVPGPNERHGPFGGDG